MPFFTYIVSYEGATHISQMRGSNFQGSGHWFRELPNNFLTPAVKQEVVKRMYGGFEEIPNRIHAWQKRFLVAGSEFVVIAVQTEG